MLNNHQSAFNHPNNPFLRRKQETKDRSVTPKEKKSKQELAEIRKQMMKARPRKDAEKSTPKLEPKREQPHEEQKNKSDHKFMSRLASGSKAVVDKKQMLQLTNKNY